MNTACEPLASRLHKELRAEILQSQKLRAYMTGAKIAFTSSLLSALVPQMQDRGYLLIIPAVAAIFFDLIVNSYSFSIKRLGSYCRHYLEPLLRADGNWPPDHKTWEQFMLDPAVKQRLATFGQLGFTGMAVVAACASICFPLTWYAPLIIASLLALFLLDVLSFRRPVQLERSVHEAVSSERPSGT